jgi:hypothetical protein
MDQNDDRKVAAIEKKSKPSVPNAEPVYKNSSDKNRNPLLETIPKNLRTPTDSVTETSTKLLQSKRRLRLPKSLWTTQQ